MLQVIEMKFRVWSTDMPTGTAVEVVSPEFYIYNEHGSVVAHITEGTIHGFYGVRIRPQFDIDITDGMMMLFGADEAAQ